METKIKNLLARLAFFAEEGMADAPIVAIAKDADALLKEMCRGFAQQQAEPVAQKPVATVRVSHEGYSMELSKYIAYALPEGLHDLYAAQQQAEPVALPVPSVLDRSHPNRAYVTLGFFDEAQCDAFVEATRYHHKPLYAAQPPAVAVAHDRSAFAAAIQTAMRDWFSEEFDASFLERMQKAGLIACAKGYPASLLASMSLAIEDAAAQKGGA